MPLSTFLPHSEGVLLYEPDENKLPTKSDLPDAPHTIIIFGWMGANARNLSKYTEGYKTLFPLARIILVTSSTLHLFSSDKTMAERMVPVVQGISGSRPATNEGKLLVHALSNGGSRNLEASCRAHRRIYGSPLSPRATILDSTPGDDRVRTEFSRGVKGVSAGVPDFFLLRFLGQAVAVVTLAILFVIPALCGMDNMVTTLRRNLNDVELLTPRGPRCYIYSRSDELIGWEAVEKHASECIMKGWRVDLVEFEGSAHVGHLKADPERYWRTVKKTWEIAVKDKRM